MQVVVAVALEPAEVEEQAVTVVEVMEQPQQRVLVVGVARVILLHRLLV